MTTEPRPLEEVLAAFREHFASDLGRVSALFRTIPRIDTGHDGCEIVLVSTDDQWMCSAFPELSAGHQGAVSVNICHRETMPPPMNWQWGQWTSGKVMFDQAGQLVEVAG